MSAARGTPTKGAGAAGVPALRDPTALAIQRIRQQREDRRRSAEHMKREKVEEAAKIEASGMPVFDADFQRMITMYRASAEAARMHVPPGEHDICVVVRKRPINKREIANRDWDSVTCLNPKVVVHAPKLKVDGITKYLENTQFEFDHTFDESSSTEDVYKYTVMPLVAYAFQKRGRGTCVAYGQTGSGKSFTISGIQQQAARDIFRAMQSKDFKDKHFSVHVSFLEIYGARCSDLLHGRNKVLIREDGKQRVVATGLEAVVCNSTEELLDTIARGNAERVTHATEVNSQSSRSHAICEITIKTPDGRTHGSLSLVDLAGSERAADSRNHNRQRRLEGAEINKSLLSLKECIRALATRKSVPEDVHVHVPFRASKLTLILRDSFISNNSRVVMIATVSPNAGSADHTQNTLRYADRIKEKSSEPGGLDDVSEAKPTGHDVTFSFLQTGPLKPVFEDFALPRVSPLTIHEDAEYVPKATPAKPAVEKSALPSRITRARVAAEARAKVGQDVPVHVVSSKRPQLDDVADGKSVDSFTEPEGEAPLRGGKELPRARYNDAVDAELPEDNVKALSPHVGRTPPTSNVHAAGFRRLLQKPLVNASAAKDEKKPSEEPLVRPDIRNKLKERARSHKAVAVAPAPMKPAAEIYDPFSDDDDDEDINEILGRAGLPKEADSKHRVVQSFVPLPAERMRAAAANEGKRPLIAKMTDKPSPQRDLALVHTLRRDELRSRGGRDAAPLPSDDSDAIEESALLQFHETAGVILDEEEELLNAHLNAIQVNAELLTEEGNLLAEVQGEGVVDYDIDKYAAKLHEVLTRKLALTQKLLSQLNVFRDHLALEENISKAVNDADLSL